MSIGSVATTGLLILVILFADDLFMRFSADRAASTGAAISVALVLGIGMGVPFPHGLRVMESTGLAAMIPWAWAVSGAASVLGSALAAGIAMTQAYSVSLSVAAAAYAVVGIISLGLSRALRRFQGGMDRHAAPRSD